MGKNKNKVLQRIKDKNFIKEKVVVI